MSLEYQEYGRLDNAIKFVKIFIDSTIDIQRVIQSRQTFFDD